MRVVRRCVNREGEEAWAVGGQRRSSAARHALPFTGNRPNARALFACLHAGDSCVRNRGATAGGFFGRRFPPAAAARGDTDAGTYERYDMIERGM